MSERRVTIEDALRVLEDVLSCATGESYTAREGIIQQFQHNLEALPAPEETEKERQNAWVVQYPDGTYVRFMGMIKLYESQEQAIRDDPGRSLSDLMPLTVIYRERHHD